jgi:hypothetical protein
MSEGRLGLRRERPHPVYHERKQVGGQTAEAPPTAFMGFPISFQKKRRIVLIIGETDSGKTLFLRLLVYCNRTAFNQVIVFSETAKYESPLRFTDSIISTYKPELLETIVSIQEKRLEMIGGDRPVDEMVTNPVPHILLVFDDLDIDYSQDAVINNLVTRSRHLYISIVFSVQYYTMVSRRMRYLASYICLRTIRGKGNMEELYDFLSQFFEDFKSFRAWSIQAMRDYATIVFYLRGDGIWDEDVFQVNHNPKDIPYFRIGGKQTTRFHTQSYTNDAARQLASGVSGVGL